MSSRSKQVCGSLIGLILVIAVADAHVRKGVGMFECSDDPWWWVCGETQFESGGTLREGDGEWVYLSGSTWTSETADIEWSGSVYDGCNELVTHYDGGCYDCQRSDIHPSIEVLCSPGNGGGGDPEHRLNRSWDLAAYTGHRAGFSPSSGCGYWGACEPETESADFTLCGEGGGDPER